MSTQATFKIETNGGICYLSGDLGSSANLTSLHDQQTPLKLNLKALGDVNSIGVRSLCLFLKAYKGKHFSYIECPPNFLEILNMVPMLLRVGENIGSVESVWIPYSCSRCYHEQNLLTKNSEIEVKGKKIKLETYDCTKCNSKKSLEPSMAPEDLLYFMIENSK